MGDSTSILFLIARISRSSKVLWFSAAEMSTCDNSIKPSFAKNLRRAAGCSTMSLGHSPTDMIAGSYSTYSTFFSTSGVFSMFVVVLIFQYWHISIFLKIALAGGWTWDHYSFSLFSVSKQRLRPLDYCAPPLCMYECFIWNFINWMKRRSLHEVRLALL